MKTLNISRICFLILLSGSIVLNVSCKKDEDDDDAAPAEPSSLFSDEFKSTTLKDGWLWANEPDQWDINTTRIDYLNFVGMLNANIFCEDNSSRLYQVVDKEADFDVYTKLRGIWGNNSSDVAGLIIKSAGSGEWVLLKLWMHGDGSGRLEFQTQCDDIISPVPGSEVNGGDHEYLLRLKKSGDDYSAYFKFNEGDSWTFIGTAQFSDELPLHVGIFGGVDSGDGELMIEADYFRVN
jgi:hypothetical protein